MTVGASEPAAVSVVEYTDPLCVWSWGSEPTFRALKLRYGARLLWRRVFGVQIGLPEEGAAPVEDAETARGRWLDVASHTGAPVPLALEAAVRTTHLACVAAIAAAEQGDEVGERALRRLRESAFVDGAPADTEARLVRALAGVEGLDTARLLHDLQSDRVRRRLADDWEEAREPRAEVVGLDGAGPHPGAAKQDGSRTRYVFPTLIVTGPGGSRVVPGWREYAEYVEAIEQASPGLAGLPRPYVSAAAALAQHGSLTPRELVSLTGSDEPPSGSERIETASVPLYRAAKATV